MKGIQSVADDLLKYPNSQARYLIHKYCFNQKINYWLRNQFPEDSKDFLDEFKKTQTRLIASYHGIYDQETINNQPELFMDLYKRVSFPIAMRPCSQIYRLCLPLCIYMLHGCFFQISC